MVAAMAKTLPKEIIPRFGLPGFLQSHHSPAVLSQVTKGITNALGVNWSYHSAWRPQLTGK